MTRSPFAKIARRNPLSEAFAQAAWVSWSPPHGVQSECPPVARQLLREKIVEDLPLDSPAAIWLERGHLVTKLHRRRRAAEGSKRVRTCICHKYPGGLREIHVPQLFRPACNFWGNLRRRVRVGGDLIPCDDRAEFHG